MLTTPTMSPAPATATPMAIMLRPPATSDCQMMPKASPSPAAGPRPWRQERHTPRIRIRAPRNIMALKAASSGLWRR